jgi:hypothetical protein
MHDGGEAAYENDDSDHPNFNDYPNQRNDGQQEQNSQ